MNHYLSHRSSETFPVPLDAIRGVILDLDGTLYSQKRLRSRMAVSLARYYLLRPWRIRDLRILFHFRRLREVLAEKGEGGVAQQQFAVTAKTCHCSLRQVERVVEEWINQRPLQYLASCRYDFADTLLACLSQRKVLVAVLSDHPTKSKLKALDLEDVCSFSSTDPCIDRLKPDPSGLLHICRQWDLSPGQCLVIGDRDDRDGEAARRAGMPYVIVPEGLDFTRIDQLFRDIT